ncbi:52 kDa repressor of the inhibitor of the protein kinase-like [Sipha flava]|uniref:52 kDa repressor of the inhibitor of the protein kinase-like n=1 Tax=Sipha flava TaxID=143950 RepID=A0A8B8FRP5_9HEMI|nr:52 kDa repressor of the inhibitor of the protein kinase-like [Sipha flava]
MPLRGKTDETAIFNSLLKFRVDAGNTILNDHLQNSAANATYTSHRIQNELINICNEVLLEHIIKDVKESQFFSVIADESCDISGIEQLSLGVRFVHKMSTGKFCVREEFLGFVPLQRLDAETISEQILSTLIKFGLDLSKMVGQAYDGCSTMAGKISGVRKRIEDKYPNANFFHFCLFVMAEYSSMLEPVANVL